MLRSAKFRQCQAKGQRSEGHCTPSHTHTHHPKKNTHPSIPLKGDQCCALRPVCPTRPHPTTENYTAGSSSPNCAGPRSGGTAGGGGGRAPQVRGPWAVGGRQRTQTSPAEHALLAISQPLSLSLSTVGRGGLVEKRREGGTGRIQSTKATRRTTALRGIAQRWGGT